MYNLAGSLSDYLRVCCALSLVSPLLSLTPPKHFLQGKILRTDLLTLSNPFSNCGPARRCQGGMRSASNPPYAKQVSWNSRQVYNDRKPPRPRFSSEETLSRSYPNAYFKTSIPESSKALPCDVSLSPDCVAQRSPGSESDSDVEKLRAGRQPAHVMPLPPPKITIIITSLGMEYVELIDKEPDMNVLSALRKFGHLLDTYDAGEISHFLMALIPSRRGHNCRIRSWGGFNGLMDAQWHLVVTDGSDRVVYSGYCLRENMRVDPGYTIRLTDQSLS